MRDTLDTTDQGTPLPPHEAANMMSLYMTRYDYDYNREGWEAREGCGDLEAEVSGAVRNRPIFAYGSPEGDRDARTVYQVDYTAKDRAAQDLQGLAASIAHGAATAAATTAIATTAVGDKGTAYQREWYRPGLTPSLRKDDGTLPQTAYQEDYAARRADTAARPTSNEPPSIYAGAAAVQYNADLLKPNGVVEDDGADIAPKITAKESLLPRGWVPGMETTRPPVTRSTGPSSTLGPATAVSGTYVCTSWDIGDVSQAHPSQLPVSLSHSIAAAGVDVTANPDKAALLRQLAGMKSGVAAGTTQRGNGNGRLRDEHDRTNPQLIPAQAQRTCGVSRRLECEHHVQMSMYKSDFVDQGQLPELPGNPAGPADVRDTQTCPAATAGEMTAGQLSRSTRAVSALRNTHGTLTSTAAALDSVRATEKAIAIEKADPHRHKLH